jgi:hypothetical protein
MQKIKIVVSQAAPGGTAVDKLWLQGIGSELAANLSDSTYKPELDHTQFKASRDLAKFVAATRHALRAGAVTTPA